MRTILIAVSLLPLFASAQTFTIKIDSQSFNPIDIGDTKFRKPIKSFEIKKNEADAQPKQYTVQAGDDVPRFKTDGQFQTVSFTSDVRLTGSLSILDETGKEILTFKLPAESESQINSSDHDQKSGIELPAMTASQYIANILFPKMLFDVPNEGLKIVAGAANTAYSGDNYIHLFFDGNGNTLIRAIPIGIERANYVVHVVYLVPKSNPQTIDYKINAAPADIAEGVLIRGDGSLAGAPVINNEATGMSEVYEWRHYEMALTPSSNDMKFDIVRSVYQIAGNQLTLPNPNIVATRTIRMKRIYHGSIDIGIVQTELANPTYSLVESPADPTQKVMKITDNDKRVFALAMYTFYVSPVILVEKLFGVRSAKKYRWEGRSFVEDHRILERIYPTFGISLSERLLDNIFIGAKWEFIRGGSIFFGYHMGKVNTFDTPPNFVLGQTPITQPTFDLRKNTKWTDGTCWGLNLDLRIITNLFQQAPAGGATNQ